MIELVLQADRLKAFAFENARVTLKVGSLDQDFAVTANTRGEIRNRKTAFAARDGALLTHQLRIEHDEQPVAGMLGSYINDEDSQIMPDLRRGHADAGACLHGVHQILGDLLHQWVLPIRAATDLLQDRIGIKDDGLDPQS